MECWAEYPTAQQIFLDLSTACCERRDVRSENVQLPGDTVGLQIVGQDLLSEELYLIALGFGMFVCAPDSPTNFLGPVDCWLRT
jgi:hypothetical protein